LINWFAKTIKADVQSESIKDFLRIADISLEQCLKAFFLTKFGVKTVI